jgi:hypothetical protein
MNITIYGWSTRGIEAELLYCVEHSLERRIRKCNSSNVLIVRVHEYGQQ